MSKKVTDKTIPQAEFSPEALFEAYYDCRRHRRANIQAVDFEFDLEKNIFELYEEILNDSYQVGKSICFVVTLPKPREVWAGAFRDRIIHHLIYNAIKDRFDKVFIDDVFSCIPKRGTLKGAQKAAFYAKKLTKNYTQKAYFMKADISNFFNSIDKEILFEEVRKYVYEPWLVRLIEKVLFHDPKNNVFMKSPKWLFEQVPAYKSLFNIDAKKGLPIGNLTSQFFANVYLNPLDQYVKNELKCKYYLRYVDDILLLHQDAGWLNRAYSKINRFLLDNLAMTLNHRKKNMNLICRGFDFVGHMVKPNRIFLRTTIIKKSFETIKKWEKNPNRFCPEELEIFRNKINSYLGMYKHINGYNLRKKICMRATTLFTHPDEDFSKIIITNYNEEKK